MFKIVFLNVLKLVFLHLKTGSVRQGKKKNRRGSRRGSTSSDTGTPVPDSSWTDEHLRPVEEQESSGPKKPAMVKSTSVTEESTSRGRHVSSPVVESRNRNEQLSTVRTVSPSGFLRPALVISPPHSSIGAPQRQTSHSFQHHHQPASVYAFYRFSFQHNFNVFLNLLGS